jgi:hypothetical protein
VKVERADGSIRHEYAVNLSASGLCLHAQAPLAVGEELRVSFQLPSDPHVIRAVCKVVWTRHEGEPPPVPRCWETGLSLVEVAARDAERLAWFVSAQVDRR